MYVDRIEVSFDAGHRLMDYQGKCAAPHGHTYKAEVFVATDSLDRGGLAMDFGLVKAEAKGWIDEHWDHAFLANDQDEGLINALRSIPESKLYLFASRNPSAEVMAEELFEQIRRQLGPALLRVRMWESPTQYCEFVPLVEPESIHQKEA